MFSVILVNSCHIDECCLSKFSFKLFLLLLKMASSVQEFIFQIFLNSGRKWRHVVHLHLWCMVFGINSYNVHPPVCGASVALMNHQSLTGKHPGPTHQVLNLQMMVFILLIVRLLLLIVLCLCVAEFSWRGYTCVTDQSLPWKDVL